MSSTAPVVVEQVAADTQPSVVSQPNQYTMAMPTITYAAPQPVTYMAQPQVIQSGFPVVQPVTYVQVPAGNANQQGTYVRLPEAEAVQQMVSHPHAPVHQGGSAELVQPVTYVQAPQAYEVVAGEGAVAESVSSNYATQGYVQQPSVFNISPEIFAKLAAGGTLTPEELAQLTGSPLPAISDPSVEAQIESAALGQAENPGTSSGANVSSSKKKSNKSLKSKKKRAKGCC